MALGMPAIGQHCRMCVQRTIAQYRAKQDWLRRTGGQGRFDGREKGEPREMQVHLSRTLREQDGRAGLRATGPTALGVYIDAGGPLEGTV